MMGSIVIGAALTDVATSDAIKTVLATRLKRLIGLLPEKSAAG
jgi:hypothetical protein